MKFEDMLLTEKSILLEKTSRMTQPQRKMVADLGKVGWSILKKDGTKVIMQKNDKESYVDDEGKVSVIKENVSYDVTEIITTLDLGD